MFTRIITSNYNIIYYAAKERKKMVSQIIISKKNLKFFCFECNYGLVPRCDTKYVIIYYINYQLFLLWQIKYLIWLSYLIYYYETFSPEKYERVIKEIRKICSFMDELFQIAYVDYCNYNFFLIDRQYNIIIVYQWNSHGI